MSLCKMHHKTATNPIHVDEQFTDECMAKRSIFTLDFGLNKKKKRKKNAIE